MTAEQFIKDYTNHCSNELCYEEGLGNLYEPWLTPEQALRAVEIAKDAFIEKVCEGIEHLLSGYIIRNFHFGDSYEVDTLIEDIKNYMKGE